VNDQSGVAMDSRHETAVQETLNALIMQINAYLIDNTDELVADPRRLMALERIAQRIYQAADTVVDASELISKHNLLSLHPLLLPVLSALTHDDSSRLLSVLKVVEEVSLDKSTVFGNQLIPMLKEILTT
jgi:hypothetical protein